MTLRCSLIDGKMIGGDGMVFFYLALDAICYTITFIAIPKIIKLGILTCLLLQVSMSCKLEWYIPRR